jgi:hypothetical protein
MKISQIQTTKDKFQFLRNKKLFSEILKSMGKNVMRELFLIDKVETLSKSEFRRYIDTKVKNYLSYKFVDFENISQISLFDKLKKNINRELNIRKGIILEEEEISTDKNPHFNTTKYNKTEVDNFIMGNNLTTIKRRFKPMKLIRSLNLDKDEKSTDFNEYNFFSQMNEDNESPCHTDFSSPNLDSNKTCIKDEEDTSVVINLYV